MLKTSVFFLFKKLEPLKVKIESEKKITEYVSSIRNENLKIHCLNPKFSGN